MVLADTDFPQKREDYLYEVDLTPDFEYEVVDRMVQGLIGSVPPQGYRLESCLDPGARMLRNVWEDDLGWLAKTLGVALEQLTQNLELNAHISSYCEVMETEYADPTMHVIEKLAAAVGVDLFAADDGVEN